jgi:hypothetical protein
MKELRKVSGKGSRILKWLLVIAGTLSICWLGNYFVPFLGILLILAFGFLFSILIPQTRWFSLLCVTVLSGFFVPMCGMPIILIILLLLSASNPQMKRLVKIAIVLFVFGAVGALAVKGSSAGLVLLFFLPYIVAPLLAMIASSIQIFSKPAFNRFTHIFLLIFLFGFFLINVRTYVILSSPIFYMPPALTNENYGVYKECIKFVRKHDERKDLVFYMQGVISGRKEPNESEISSAMEDFRRIKKELETQNIAKQMRQIMCARFERCDDTVIFYKGSSWLIPITAKEIWHTWPSGHGVAYSLSGKDPNQSDDPILKEYKPFIRIQNNWYISRGLLMSSDGRQYHSIPPVFNALVDRSLSLESVDPNNLNEHI